MCEPTVYIVDDEPAVLQSLSWLLESIKYKIQTFERAADFLRTYADQPGCLLLDVRMPGMSGPELQAALKEKGDLLPIICMSGHADVGLAVNAMKVGAMDFLMKPINNQRLLDIVSKAIKWDAGAREERQVKERVQARIDTLTPREREVMPLMIEGKLTKVIAHELGISPNTAELHRAKVMKKMQVKSLAQLVSDVLKKEALIYGA